MSGIVHHECSLGLLPLYLTLHFRIGIAGYRSLALVSIPHYLLYEERRIARCHGIGHSIGVFHVQVVVSIVAHEHDDILPIACVLVAHVVYRLVDHRLGIGFQDHREAPYTNIFLVAL